MVTPNKQDRILVVVALVLASLTYYFINTSVQKASNKANDPSYRLIKLTAKIVPVKVRFASTPPDGYRLLSERVTVDPPKITLIGPEALLEETASADTAILDISQTTRKTVKSIPIETVAGISLAGESFYVQVTVPIEKVEAP